MSSKYLIKISEYLVGKYKVQLRDPKKNLWVINDSGAYWSHQDRLWTHPSANTMEEFKKKTYLDLDLAIDEALMLQSVLVYNNTKE